MILGDYKFYVDWNRSGLFNHAYSDITTRVTHADWKFGASGPPPDYITVGVCNLRVLNGDGFFCKENEASPIYGLDAPNLLTKVTMEINGGGAVTMFQGRLQIITPETGEKLEASTATIEVYGMMSSLVKKKVRVALQEGITVGAAIAKVLDGANFPIGDRTLDTGQTTLEKWWVLREQYALDAIQSLVDAEVVGRFGDGKDGKLIFWDRAHYFTSPNDVVRQTFGIGGITMWNPQMEAALPYIYNTVHTSVRTFNHSDFTRLVTITDSQEGLGGRPLKIEPGETITVRFELNEKTSPSDYISVYEWGGSDAAAITCYAAATIDGEVDQDLTLGVIPGGDSDGNPIDYGQMLEATFHNDNSVTVWLVVLYASGVAVVEGDSIPIETTADDSADDSLEKYDECEYPNPSTWITNYESGMTQIEYLVNAYKNPRQRVSFEIIGNIDLDHLTECQTIHVGDRIHIEDDQSPGTVFGLYVDSDFVVDEVQHVVDNNGRIHTVRVTATEVLATQLPASATSYTPKIITPEDVMPHVPDDLQTMGAADGLYMISGVIAEKWNAGIYEAEFRAKWFANVQSKYADLRTITEGGTLEDNGTTEIIEIGLQATEEGCHWDWNGTTAGQGVWYFAYRLKNLEGWSVWSDGNDTPEFVVDYIKTKDAALATDGPPEDWSTTIQQGPSPGTVVVKVTRPTINGALIYFAFFQIKDYSSESAFGSFLPIDSNDDPAQIIYDGSNVSHTYNKNTGTITIDDSMADFFADSDSAPNGMMILMDVRGAGNFARDYCRWQGLLPSQVNGGTITGAGALTPPQIDADSDGLITDVRLMIVRPPWEWDTGGYLAQDGFWMGEYWEGGGDASTEEFVSKPFTLPAGTTIDQIGARVWFANSYSVGSNEDSSGQPIGGSTAGYANDYCVPLTDAAVIETDARKSGNPDKLFVVSIATDRILGNPTNAKCGQLLVWRIINTSGAEVIVTLDDKFRNGKAFPPSVSADLGPFDIVETEESS